MADRSIGELPLAPQVTDTSLLAVEQGGIAHRMTGAQFKEFAKISVTTYVESAKQSAQEAAASKAKAAKSAEAAAESASDAADSARSAQQYSGKPPVIIDGRWWTWDADKQQYVDTGEAARGNLMYATFFLDPRTGDLYMYTDNEYTGPQFRLSGADLEVVLNYG